jgi:hypothetical protein
MAKAELQVSIDRNTLDELLLHSFRQAQADIEQLREWWLSTLEGYANALTELARRRRHHAELQEKINRLTSEKLAALEELADTLQKSARRRRQNEPLNELARVVRQTHPQYKEGCVICEALRGLERQIGKEKS